MRINSFKTFESETSKLKKFDVNGELLVAAFGKYGNDRTAIELLSAKDGEPWYVATVNIPEEKLDGDEIIVKEYGENEGVLAALQKAGIVGKIKRDASVEGTHVVDLLVDPSSEEFIDMMKAEGFEERFSKLPKELRDQIKSVYEKDENAVICGSTALFLYGNISRTPQDLDIISARHQDLRGTVSESSGASRPEDFEEFDEFYKADQELYDEIADIAYKAVDFYDLIAKVKEAHNITGRLDDKTYGMCSSAWTRLKKDESFKHKFSGIGNYKMCVFEAVKEQKPTKNFVVEGITVKLEDIDTVLEYKKMYGRTKDIEDLNVKIKMFESFNGKRIGIKTFDKF